MAEKEFIYLTVRSDCEERSPMNPEERDILPEV